MSKEIPRDKIAVSRKYELLLVLPVPLRKIGVNVHFEMQAHHGIQRWLDSFENILISAPVIPDCLARERSDIVWVPFDGFEGRVEIIEMPWCYRPDKFAFSVYHYARKLANAIEQSRYLQFAIGGLWGDWAAVGATIARASGREYAIHTDRVDHEAWSSGKKTAFGITAMRANIESALIKIWHRKLIESCEVGLFHGADTYSVYKPWMRNPSQAFCIHDIHDAGMGLESEAGFELTDIVNRSEAINILYAGRLSSEKAPIQWLDALKLAHDSGVDFNAEWIGDGPLRAEFEARVLKLGLSRKVKSPGFISDRQTVAEYYRKADLFLFTHVTPESPRCLLEALRFGLPIVGYDSEFARDLVSRNGGGVFVAKEDHVALANTLRTLTLNRNQLLDLTARARKDGGRFSSRAVFEERSRLIKEYL